MFRHEGPTRSVAKNATLAAYLAFVGGYVNSSGCLLVGSFTSHVTGSVGRLSIDLASRNSGAAGLALAFVVSFFVGAVGASLIVESSVFHRAARAYAFALVVESCLLGAFIVIADLSGTIHPRWLDAEAVLLCTAMGMQNSLVTRLSGAVVRTTHLTGIVTDLGIEVARAIRFYRGRLRPPSSTGRNPPSRPDMGKLFLLSTIFFSFSLGAALGATLTLVAGRWAMLLPVVATLGGSLNAFTTPKGDRPAG